MLYAFPQLVYLYTVKVWTFALALLAPKQPYRAIGGIHVRAGSERVRILENVIVGGGGNGVTLGGDLDPADVPPATRLTSRLTLADVAGRAADAAPAPVTVTVTKNGQFLALVEDEAGKPVPDIDVYLEGPSAASDRTDGQGMASIKATPGTYTLEVSPAYRIVRVAESREDDVLVSVVTVAARVGAVAVRGFLHEITIEQNDISTMGLSGIGFALRAGAAVKAPVREHPGQRSEGSVSGLHRRGRAQLRADAAAARHRSGARPRHHRQSDPSQPAQSVRRGDACGRRRSSAGAVSRWRIVESVVISENHVYENGPNATDPVCGVFIGYGNDIEITDNVLAGNGAIAGDFEHNRQAGIRGGFYMRFAGALTTHSRPRAGASRRFACRTIASISRPAAR